MTPCKPRSPPEKPSAKQPVTECYDYYRYVFEKRLKDESE